MKIKNLAVIGAGNMGGSIVNGIIKSGYLPASSISIGAPREATRKLFESKGVNAYENDRQAAKHSDTIILAVKPSQMNMVMDIIRPELSEDKILISIVSGLYLDKLSDLSGKKSKVFRLMPNTAISIQESMTCIATNEKSEEIISLVQELFDQLGKTVVIPEDMMSSATVLASCGTAYALRYARACMEGGIEMGFKADIAQFMAAQTIKGAAQMLIENGNHPEQEIDKVCTPKGITISGLNEMEHNGFSSSIIKGLISAYNKAEKK